MCFDLSEIKMMQWSISIGSCANMGWNPHIERIVLGVGNRLLCYFPSFFVRSRQRTAPNSDDVDQVELQFSQSSQLEALSQMSDQSNISVQVAN